MEGLDLGGIWLHTLCGEDCTVEGDLRLPDLTLQTVENYAMLLGSCHQLEEVSVMFLRGTAVDAYIIMHYDYAGETVCCLVHLHLKDMLGHLQAKWHMQEPVSAMMSIKSGQIQRFLIKVDTPQAILSIQINEAFSTT